MKDRLKTPRWLLRPRFTVTRRYNWWSNMRRLAYLTLMPYSARFLMTGPWEMMATTWSSSFRPCSTQRWHRKRMPWSLPIFLNSSPSTLRRNKENSKVRILWSAMRLSALGAIRHLASRKLGSSHMVWPSICVAQSQANAQSQSSASTLTYSSIDRLIFLLLYEIAVQREERRVKKYVAKYHIQLEFKFNPLSYISINKITAIVLYLDIYGNTLSLHCVELKLNY